MINTTNAKVFERYAKEGHDRYYDKVDLPMTEAHKIAFHLGKLNYQVDNGGFTQWISNVSLSESNEVLLPAIEKGIEDGIVSLSPLYEMLVEIEEAVTTGTVKCEKCGGSGISSEADLEFEEEECDLCYGKGELKSSEEHYDEEKVRRFDESYWKLDEDQLFDAYGQLVLLYIPEEEKNSAAK